MKAKVQFSPETTAPHSVIDPLQFTDEDPGRRLEVLISAYSETSYKVQYWGNAFVELYGYANTLVHWLNGVPLEKYADNPRCSFTWKERNKILRWKDHVEKEPLD